MTLPLSKVLLNLFGPSKRQYSCFRIPSFLPIGHFNGFLHKRPATLNNLETLMLYPPKVASLLVAIVSIASLQSVSANGQWVTIFNGETLDGWRANENADSWAVEDGAIVAKGDRSHLFYEGEVGKHNFKNFEIAFEVMTTPGSNSGVYVHTWYQEEGWPAAGYEMQILNSNPEGPANYVEHKMTGSIYAIRNTWQSPAKDNQWFEYRIKVQGKTIQTYIDERLVCEYTEPYNPWRPEDKKHRLLKSGTVALQAHDPGSIVRFRKIKVKLLPNDLPHLGRPLEDKDLDQLVTEFSNSNHPLIDVGVEVPSLSQTREVAAEARKYGLSVVDADFLDTPQSLLIVNDSEEPPSEEALKLASEDGIKIAFSSGGATSIDEERIKARLLAMKEAGLDWRDLWVPGK